MSPAAVSYVALAVAIVFEVVGTTALQQSQQFTRPVPTMVMSGCYLAAFCCLIIAGVIVVNVFSKSVSH
ncbi:MAG: hypothetical protein CML67_13545 [Rhodobacteraceae bacterium]|nr:hypothetical protein [Paracoccaceae bacterium]